MSVSMVTPDRLTFGMVVSCLRPRRSRRVLHSEPIGGATGNVSPAACCRAAVLPIVRRAVIPVVAVVRGGVVTPVVGVDVGKLPPPEIGAPIGITEKSLWPRFVDVDARSISFCRLSRHGQDWPRHHRENAEQGVAGLAHSPLHWIQSAVPGSKSPRSNEASRYPALRAAYRFWLGGTAR